MSYQDQSGYPPPREQESQYPPPPGEEDDRARGYHQRGPSNGGNVVLPSITPYEHYGAPPHNGYPADPRGYQQDPYRAPPVQYRDERPYPRQEFNGPGGPNMAFTQSAPRQRTAIACRYCRRRKIRCSGFDQNPEGRCSNCQRFQQECIFTPVSSQAQAFVPAHAVYPGMRNMGVGPDGRPRPMIYPQGTQLFGAHGQPLGAIPPQPSPYEYPAPSPTGSFGSFSEDRGSQPPHDQSRKRPQQDPHPSILPPPLPGQPGQPYARVDAVNRRQAVDDDLRLPPVTPTGASAANYSPGSSTSSQSGLQAPQHNGLPPMTRTPPPRSSPGEVARADPMSLGNIMDHRRPNMEIDRGMLGRLDRKPK
ncbi:hypothetical protein WAI453_002237 [Rhynchosporium graminicola]|uniref:Zn(2)-C6 fungal-type domain-containing protein n=1 Tax=Rhynchosporium graminicola TaxID=2792576 RepID=A0A1E1LC80_9HELO|nr:uncharacterized protein RCO7_09547 [Rhynchosporium commune]